MLIALAAYYAATSSTADLDTDTFLDRADLEAAP